MAVEYVTKNYDMLDRICYKYYKTTDFTAQVLEQNRYLAAYGPILPAGLTIILPDIKKPAQKRKIQLW
ncbi:tail protein X [Francisella philomiragia]|uniref:tail protein X n=1 Tax=Francisella philomiragia TaxID=28110 RepID=UPI001C9DDA68|nr:tail protein X [Francisella philomiragia]MBY7733502.1 tail protein X [Francisella philomiragia]